MFKFKQKETATPAPAAPAPTPAGTTSNIPHPLYAHENINFGPHPHKIKLEHNIPLTDGELSRIDAYCDVIGAVKAGSKAYVEKHNLDPNVVFPNGLIWDGLDDSWGGSWGALREKHHDQINVFRIQGNVFSDRATTMYENDEFFPMPNEWDFRYLDMANVMPEKWQVKLEARFGEIGWNCHGHPVNWTTTTHQERFNLLYMSGICDLLDERRSKGKTVRCLEVGGGAGEIGYTFCKALPGMTWYDVDLPSSLIHTTAYLATMLPKKKHYIYTGSMDLPEGIDRSIIITDPKKAASVKDAVVSVPNFLIRELKEHLKLDLAFNTWSFSEMDSRQVVDYGENLQTMLGDDGVMLEQNIDHRNMEGANYCKLHFAEIFKYRWNFIAEACQPYHTDIQLYGGEVDIWGNKDPRELLGPYADKIDRKKIGLSMWRKCGRPWAYMAATHLRDVFTEITVGGFEMFHEKKQKAA